jgi:hypothetical protein
VKDEGDDGVTTEQSTDRRHGGHSGWHRGRRRWDLPPNVTKILLASIPIILATRWFQ